MLYKNTKEKSDQAELRAICDLVNSGYKVAIPFGENAPYDVIAESETGQLYRIQVRFCSWKKEVLAVSLRAVSKNYYRTLDLSRIDAFAAFDGKDIYWIPSSEFREHKSALSLRRAPPKNGQKVGVRMAKKFKGRIKKCLP